jgi:hypothetical protein
VKQGFQKHYIKWREVRLNKLIEVLGKEWFVDKNLLEIGCGFGNLGRTITDSLGARVVLAEGRAENLEICEKKNPNHQCVLLNNDEPWSLNEKFDGIIHWGTLYHLYNWMEDLERTFDHSNEYVFLETEVCDSDNIDDVVVKTEDHMVSDKSLTGTVCIPTAARIEKWFDDNNIKWTRYDDEDLNTSPHNYSWEVENTNTAGSMHRRFWICKK